MAEVVIKRQALSTFSYWLLIGLIIVISAYHKNTAKELEKFGSMR